MPMPAEATGTLFLVLHTETKEGGPHDLFPATEEKPRQHRSPKDPV